MTNRSELKSCKDTALTAYCTTKHECRQKLLVQGLGSEEDTGTTALQCCDIYTRGTIPFLNLCKPIRVKRKPKQSAVRSAPCEVVTDVKNRLLIERRSIVNNSKGLRTIGSAVTCPMVCLNEICKRLDYIVSAADIACIQGLHDPFVQRFFIVILDTLKHHGL